MMKKFLITLFALALCLGVTSCGADIDVETGIKSSVYDLDDGDMISFYMTSDVKPDGVWDYSIDGDIFETVTETEENKKYGAFGSDTANYKTLILKPTEEGSAKITFTLNKTSETKEFELIVTKDEDGIFRINAE